MIKNKRVLREKYKIIRNDVKKKKEKSDIIFKNIVKNDLYKKSKVIALYYSIKNEVETYKIIEYSLKIGKKVSLPKIIGNHKIEFFRILNTNNLIESKLGILEPDINRDLLIKKDDIDLYIVPGICFDKNKNRLGYGKGFYDYYLENTNSKKIGICFDEQISDEVIDTNKFDVKMDLIITDKKIYN